MGDTNLLGVTLAGDPSVVHLRDYIESVAGSGRTVPRAVRDSPTAWPEAIGISRPPKHPLLRVAAQFGPNEIPKHAPPTKLGAIRKLEEVALNVEVAPFIRAFLLGVRLMMYASLRISDVQRIRRLGGELGFGVRRTHPIEDEENTRPTATAGGPSRGRFGLGGMDNADYRVPFCPREHNGTNPLFVSPRLNRRWVLGKAEPAAYACARRKLALICAVLNGPHSETYSLHPQKEFLPSSEAHMYFAIRGLNVIGY